MTSGGLHHPLDYGFEILRYFSHQKPLLHVILTWASPEGTSLEKSPSSLPSTSPTSAFPVCGQRQLEDAAAAT